MQQWFCYFLALMNVSIATYPLLNTWNDCQMGKSDTFSKLQSYELQLRSEDETNPQQFMTHMDYYRQYETDGLTSVFNINQILKKNENSELQHRRLTGVPAKCIFRERPLCYTNVCNLTDTNSGTIPIFYKRILASNKTTKAVWMIQGGPGAPSNAMDKLLLVLQQFLGDSVDLYTMDHRGTGNSQILKCASISGTLGTCVNQIKRYEMDDETETYSVTSAALDIKQGIEEYNIGQEVYVYGVSYGTYVVERLMQLQPKYVKGYILDSVVSQTGDSTFTTWDTDVGDIGDTFLQRCDASKTCSRPFNNVPLKTYIKNLYKEMDANMSTGNSSCAALLSSAAASPASDAVKGISLQRRRPWMQAISPSNLSSIDVSMAPSDIAKEIANTLLQSQALRPYIPVLAYLLKNCDDNNYQAFENFLVNTMGDNSTTTNQDGQDSIFLYYLIVFSEFWEIPTPSADTLTQIFENQSIAGGMQNYVPMYCTLTQANDSACEDYPTSDIQFSYPKDEYYTQYSTIPEGTSVLMLNGKLDPQTHYKHAMNQYEHMKGNNKLLLFFNDSAHGVIINTPLKDPSKLPCGAKIIASYIQNGGDLKTMDTSCMKNLQPLMLSLPSEVNVQILGRHDAYGDGHITSNGNYGMPCWWIYLIASIGLLMKSFL